MLKPLYMTKSSIIFLNQHLKNSVIKINYLPEVPNYVKKYKVYTEWEYTESSEFLEYDRESTMYVEKYTLCELFVIF